MTERFVVFDTEYASWKGFLTAPEEERKKAEIVQIAALKINLRDLSVADRFNVYVKPRFAPKLTDYFIALTGITDEQLEREGISFPEAYRLFKQFVDRLPCYSHAWTETPDSLADGRVFGYNLDLFGLKDGLPPDYRNIAPWFKQKYREKGINVAKQSSGQIAAILGAENELAALGLNEHNAFYDVSSILIGLKRLGFDKTV